MNTGDLFWWLNDDDDKSYSVIINLGSSLCVAM
jgi:hypothetical protein